VSFDLFFTPTASKQYDALEKAKTKQFRAVDKALDFLASNPRHSGLNSHKYVSQKGPGGCDLWESYAENATPGAYRIFWIYGPGKGRITVAAIVPHP